ncbi:hypothetical protein GQ43DRAFT_483469 [Delitschia confertaspora ATCC 74209]|uniref:Zn(2)-C6 fungal-type domain-containing protein n=1 Tax=Delitschia confertaspora ATCC 74209 TaxID=1513339 RepID=A0A9P4MPT0_9PLEO|nr:hypothetical protein GQ43DRAFT_483469 [Delitschia confertaspora ATCC 74209]
MTEEELYSVLRPSNPHDRVQKQAAAQRNSAGGGGAAPNPRSCVTCRKRKVKCDKKHPCSNCARAKTECVFPSPGRAPRKSRKPPDGELMERLRRLEGVVQSLNAQVEEEHAEPKSWQSSTVTGDFECPEKKNTPSAAVNNSIEGLETRFGRLVVDQGRSRYIKNNFWASLNNEVEDLKAILIGPSGDEADDHSSPETDFGSIRSNHQSFMFGYSSLIVDMMPLHPPTERALEYWAVYKENVDALVKILHVPTFEPIFLEALKYPERISKGLESLLFAIYYGAVTSTLPEECLQRWGEERSLLLEKYRFALEQTLARANFLHCDEIVVLKAFLIFLILLRRNEDARKIWTLTGLVVRIAQTLGIHRDGSHFNLSPFETEMRRRLWWQVCILDARASEDHGCDPTLTESQFDTKLPLNVNDSDLYPSMTSLPEERIGFTDMTFCIIRFEVANIFRRILYVPPAGRCNEYFSSLSIPEKEKWISEWQYRIEEKYLKHCDMSDPLPWVTATISRLIMSKMWLIAYHPHQRRDGGVSLPQSTRDKLFLTSLENVEYSTLLETEARTMKWGWLFRTYVQWHAIAFLLSELCVRTKGEAVERAWRALEATAGRWWYLDNTESSGRGKQQDHLWRPLKKLMMKARAARERELALERTGNPGRYQYGSQKVEALGQEQNSEGVDRLLRPHPPEVGDVPTALPPGWLESPLNETQSPGGVPMSGSSGMNGGPSNGLNAGIVADALKSRTDGSTSTTSLSEAAQDFQNISSMGFDFIIRDIMDTTTYEGTDIAQHNMNGSRHDSSSSYTQTTTPSTRSTPHSSDNPALNQPPFNPSQLSNNNFANPSNQNVFFPTSPINSNEPWMSLSSAPSASNVPNLPTNQSRQPDQYQKSGSPVLGEGSLDWANWDDMVREYGMDADAPQAVMTTNRNGGGGLSMPTWF